MTYNHLYYKSLYKTIINLLNFHLTVIKNMDKYMSIISATVYNF